MDKREKEKRGGKGRKKERRKRGKLTLCWFKRVLAEMPLKKCFWGLFHGILLVREGAK